MIEYVRKYPNPNAGEQVPSQGPEDQAPIGVLSFAPDRADVLAKAPLRGTRGGLFRQIMSRLGLSPDVVWKFYVRQRPGALSSDDIEAETREFWKELRWLIESKGLKVVIGLATPELLKFFGISGTPEQVRGSLYEINLSWPGLVTDPEAEPCDVPMIMTYDPEFLISKRWTTGGKGTADNIVNSLLDFEKAIKIGSEGYVRYIENFVIAPSFEQLVAWAEDVLRRQPLIAVDIETDGFSGAPVVIGFATSSSDAFSVPIRRQGGLNYWPASLWTKVKFYVDRILGEVPQVYQNALFDVPRLAKAGFNAKFRMVRHDTMLLHHVVNPEAKHNLGYITSVYGATPFWKEGIFDRGQNILEIDERQVWTYNLRDCVVLHQVLPGLLADLNELGPATARVYYDETLPLMRPVHAMTLIGIRFSQARAEAFKERLTAEILELEHKIRKTYGLPDEFNLGSSDHLGILLYGVIPEEFKTAGAQARAREVSGKTDTKIYAKLISMERLAKIPRIWAFGKSMFRVPVGQKSGKPGTGSGDRLSMIVAANKRMDFIEARPEKFAEEAEQIQRLLVFMDMFETYQELTKLMSTYTEFPTWADGRVHGSYLIHGTSTGRLACVSGDTLILTDQGEVPIEEYDVQSGARVLTHKGNWEIVRRKIYKGIDRMHKLLLRSGESLTCTEDHRLLRADGVWVRVGDLKKGDKLIYVSEQKACEQSRNPQTGSGVLSESGETNDASDSGLRKDWASLSNRDITRISAPRTVPSRTTTSVLEIENGGQKPNDRQNRRTAPTLDRRMLRRQGLLNDLGPWEEVFSSSSCDGRRVRHADRRLSSTHGCSPHRRRSVEQRFEQLSNCNQSGSCEFAREYTEVVEKTYVGELRVWDLEVDNDHSYWAAGVFNHNSRKPNMQNFPKKSKIGKEVRKLFVAPRGRVFISADYSNLEARIVGYEADEPEVQKIFAQGLNQHDINTRNLFHLEPGDPKWELARRAAKTFQFGLIQYGGSDREIHRKISIEVPELGLTLRDLQEAKNNYFKANPNLLEWRLKVASQVQHERKITNAFGRVRLFHSNNRDIIKEAYNFPMQSAAASIINDATIRIFDKLTTNYQETFLIAQIHDQLIFEAPNEPMYLKRLIKMIKTEMERPRQAWGREVSFPVDFESGPSLGELEPLEL